MNLTETFSDSYSKKMFSFDFWKKMHTTFRFYYKQGNVCGKYKKLMHKIIEKGKRPSRNKMKEATGENL